MMRRLFLAAVLLLAPASAFAQARLPPAGSGTVVTPTGGQPALLGGLLSAQFTPANTQGCFVGDSITAATVAANTVRITASGGTAPYTFSISPTVTGLSATTSSPNLYLSASTAALGTYSITITATDNVSATGSQPYTLTIATSGITLATNGSGTGTLAMGNPVGIAMIDSNRGPAFQAQFLSGRRIIASQDRNFSHPGDTTALLLARMAPILAASCGFYTLMIGTNDLGSVSTTALQNNLTSIVNQLLQTGRPVFWMPIAPRTMPPASFTGVISSGVLTASSVTGTIYLGAAVLGTGIPPNTIITSYGTGAGGAGTYNLSYSGSIGSEAMTSSHVAADELYAINRWIRGQRGTVPNLYIVDGSAAFVDTASTTGTPCTGATSDYTCTYDGLHPKGIGAQFLFGALATALTNLYPDIGYTISSNVDLYSTVNATGDLLANPMMAGSGGTASGRASGTVPTSWTVNTADAGCSPCTYTATSSASTLSDGTPAVQIVIAGTAGGGFATQAFLTQSLTNFQNFSLGDALQASCRVEMAAGSSHITAPYIELNYQSGATAYRLAAGPSGGINPVVSDASPTTAYAGTLATPLPAPALPGGLSGTLTLNIGTYITNSGSQTIAGTLKVGACSLRKV